MLGANLLSLIKALGEGVNWSLVPHCLLGMLVAMVTGYFAISLLRWLVKKDKFGYFAYYCAGVGVITMIVSIFV